MPVIVIGAQRAELCELCTGSISTGAIILIVIIVIVCILLLTQVKVWYNYFTIFQSIAVMVQELEIKAIAKVLVALFQIVGGLGGVLKVSFPVNFKDFLRDFVSVFTFDISGYFSFGCWSTGKFTCEYTLA